MPNKVSPKGRKNRIAAGALPSRPLTHEKKKTQPRPWGITRYPRPGETWVDFQQRLIDELNRC